MVRASRPVPGDQRADMLNEVEHDRPLRNHHVAAEVVQDATSPGPIRELPIESGDHFVACDRAGGREDDAASFVIRSYAIGMMSDPAREHLNQPATEMSDADGRR